MYLAVAVFHNYQVLNLQDKYGTVYYAKGQNLCRVLRQAYDDALKTVDVLIMPTIKFKATQIPPRDTPVKGWHRFDCHKDANI